MTKTKPEKWTKEQVSTLLRRREALDTVDEIAKMVGKSPNAVTAKLAYMRRAGVDVPTGRRPGLTKRTKKRQAKTRVSPKSNITRPKAAPPEPVRREYVPREPTSRKDLNLALDAHREGVDIMQLREDTCRWPLWSNDHTTGRYCGDPTAENSSWCEHHTHRSLRKNVTP